MEKQKLNRFISKYNLAGLVESVKWQSSNNTLNTSFISDDKSVLGTVNMTGFDQNDLTFGVYDTTKLIKMLGVLGADIDFELSVVNDKVASAKFKDESTSINYMLADLSVIPTVPDLKQLPEFDVKLKLDQNFITKFIKAKGALAEVDNFTFLSKNNKHQIIIGYENINSNRISIDVECETTDEVKPISFSAKYLKEILVANKEAKTATLNISTQGLAHIHFEVDEYTTDYFLVEVNS